MTLNEMVASFQSILNRDDCTDAAAKNYLLQGISRVMRDCRLPSMERTLIINTTTDPTLFFPVPRDLIQPIDLIVPGSAPGTQRALRKLSFRELVERDPTAPPQWYARSQGVMHIRGALPPNSQMTFLYYGNFTDFANDDDVNELSASTPDLGIYAALSYAGDAFQHPSTDAWENRFKEIRNEVIGMAIDLDAEGGPQQVEALYHYNTD